MAKTTAPAVIAAKAPASANREKQNQETDQLKARLAELEATIAELRHSQPEDQAEPELAVAYDQAMQAIEKLKKEKQELEDELTRKLKEQGIQISEQREMLMKQQLMLNALLKSLGMKRTSYQLNDVFAVLAQTAVKLPSRGQDTVVAIAVAAIALGTSSKSVGDSALCSAAVP